MKEIQIPATKDLVDEYNDKFNKDEKDSSADQAIINLFQKFPENKRLEDILLKFSAINTLYSTNIFDKFKMATHIRKLQIDKGLQLGDPDIVANIATGHDIRSGKTGNEKNFYSFATKYCSWHNNDAYPIYDTIVEKLLIAYRDEDEFSKFEISDLKNYKRFKEILDDFKRCYMLTGYNAKELDKFLWKYGKAIFSSNDISEMWNGYCPESMLKGKKVRMRLNDWDFFEGEETKLQICVLSGVQAIILNFRGKGEFRSTAKYADEIENGEILSPQNMDRPPFNDPTVVFQSSEEIENYIRAIK